MGNDFQSSNGSQKNTGSSDKIIINPVTLLSIIWSRWYWLLICVVVSLSIGYLYAKSARQVFMTEAVMKYDLKSKDSKFSASEMIPGSSSNSDYMAEVYSVKSSSVIKKTLDSLSTRFVFTMKDGLRDVNIYPIKPFTYDILSDNVDLYPGGEFTLRKEGNSIKLTYFNEGMEEPQEFTSIEPGTVIKIPGLAFSITSKITMPAKKVKFSYIDYWGIRGLADRVIIKEAERNLPVLRATFSSDNYAFSKDFLRTLLNTYNNYDVAAKIAASEKTLSFINEQMVAFEAQMRKSSSKLENIKQRYDLISVDATSNQFMSNVSELRTRKLNLEIQGKNFDLVTEDIKNNKEVVANVIGWDGTVDPFLNSMLQQLNDLIARRKQNLINFAETSIVIKNIDDEIASLKFKIIENIKLQRKKAEQAYAAYDNQLKELNKTLSMMPTAERDLIYTTSDVDVNKNIYTLLLNKKLETSIDKSGKTASFAMLETPMIARRTAPYEKLIILVAGFVGLILGIVSILLKRILNSKFTSIGEVGKDGKSSLIGVINHSQEARNLDEQTIRSMFSSTNNFTESINTIRTGIIYQSGRKKGNVVAVTSKISGEGKSFVSLNIAASLAKLDKSVLIVATDLRRSTLHRSFNAINETGLSTYLESDKADLAKIINRSSISNLDYITSGPVPHNPSELILKERFWIMLDMLKEEYDYIILDTAPVGLVSDSLPILRAADINIFVIRWLFSDKESDELPGKLAVEHNLKNVNVVVNDFREDKLYANMDGKDNSYSKAYTGYGNYYNDGYRDRKPLWKRITTRSR
jgi:capsular exopolysaccharide synthesis family protein